MLTYEDLKRAGFHEHQPHTFYGEGSSLEQTRVNWPQEIETSIGNRMPLLRISKKMNGDELAYVRYKQSFGIINLVIYND